MSNEAERPTGREVITALRNTDGLAGWSAKVDRMILAAEVRALWTEREAVLELHQRREVGDHVTCGHCSVAGLRGDVPVQLAETLWPCPTVQALGGAA